ncbi:MAG: flavodoxin family protein [Candidatus Thorarchaeota archaeon]|jgi:flavodoxin
MKALITYFSQTGNSKMIAEKMHEVISTKIEADIGTVRSVDLDTLDKYDVIFVGAPCHDSDLAPPVKGFLDRLPDSPRFKLIGFFTHATNMPDSERNKQLYDQWAGKCIPSFENPCKSKNIEYLGTFHCQGKASEPIEQFIHQQIITDEDEWNQYLPDLRTHPTATDIENAEKFALDILDKI